MIGSRCLTTSFKWCTRISNEGRRPRILKHWALNIEKICRLVSVPVIIKEVGNGISWEIAKKLCELGVSGIDTGGSGGTNFASIELAHNQRKNLEFLRFWGFLLLHLY